MFELRMDDELNLEVYFVKLGGAVTRNALNFEDSFGEVGGSCDCELPIDRFSFSSMVSLPLCLIDGNRQRVPSVHGIDWLDKQ